MRLNLLTILFLLGIGYTPGTQGQQTASIFIKSDKKEPFTAILDRKTNVTSTVNGMLVISGLPQHTTHDLEISFVKSRFVEQHYTVDLKDQDLGFLLTRLDTTYGMHTLASIDAKEAQNNNSGKLDTLKAHSISPVGTLIAADKKKDNKIFIKCDIATNSYVKEIYKKWLGYHDERRVLTEAGKVFGKKCFSTKQIKQLSPLFLEDSNRLDFFLASKPSLMDGFNFSDLQQLFKDSTIIKQFKNAQ